MKSALTKPNRHTQTFGYCGLEGLGVLVGLGLSELQARVYLATLKLGDGKASAVVKLSLVNHQEIHQLIDDLQELGLIQKTADPSTLTAVPFTEAATLLLQKKTSKLTTFLQQNSLCTHASSGSCFGVVAADGG